MLTGDHLSTATAIAQLVGIIGHDYPKSAVMVSEACYDLDRRPALTASLSLYNLQTGPQFDQLSEEQIDQLEQLPRVIARCAPETKGELMFAFLRDRNTGPQLNIVSVLSRHSPHGRSASSQRTHLRHDR